MNFLGIFMSSFGIYLGSFEFLAFFFNSKINSISFYLYGPNWLDPLNPLSSQIATSVPHPAEPRSPSSPTRSTPRLPPSLFPFFPWPIPRTLAPRPSIVSNPTASPPCLVPLGRRHRCYTLTADFAAAVLGVQVKHASPRH